MLTEIWIVKSIFILISKVMIFSNNKLIINHKIQIMRLEIFKYKIYKEVIFKLNPLITGVNITKPS